MRTLQWRLTCLDPTCILLPDSRHAEQFFNISSVRGVETRRDVHVSKNFFVENYWHTDNIQVVRQDSRGSQQLSENVEYDKLSSYMC